MEKKNEKCSPNLAGLHATTTTTECSACGPTTTLSSSRPFMSEKPVLRAAIQTKHS